MSGKETIEQDIVFFYKPGQRLGVVFTSIIVGGHELMTLAIINKIIHIYPDAKKNIHLYIPMENIKLIDIVKENNFSFDIISIKHRRLEIVHAFTNINYLNQCKKLLIKVFSESDDVVLIQGDIQQGSGFIVAAKWTGMAITSYLPFAHSYKKMNAPMYQIKDFLAKRCYKMCNSYITISPCFKYDLKKLNPLSNVNIIHNFVPQVSKKISQEYVSHDEIIRLFIIGRVHFLQKGHDTLLQALSGIDGFSIELNVVGDGPDKDKFLSMASRLPKNICLNYHGWVSDSWSVAEKADILVIPSRYEGVPLVMLEALERDLPVIAVARDGMKDYLPEENLYPETGNEIESLRLKLNEVFAKLIIKRQMDVKRPKL